MSQRRNPAARGLNWDPGGPHRVFPMAWPGLSPGVSEDEAMGTVGLAPEKSVLTQQYLQMTRHRGQSPPLLPAPCSDLVAIWGASPSYCLGGDSFLSFDLSHFGGFGVYLGTPNPDQYPWLWLPALASALGEGEERGEGGRSGE